MKQHIFYLQQLAKLSLDTYEEYKHKLSANQLTDLLFIQTVHDRIENYLKDFPDFNGEPFPTNEN